MEGVVGLLGSLATLMQNIGDLKNMTKLQIVQCVGWTIGGAVTAYTIKPHDYVFIAAGALAGLLPHLTGLVQQSPITPTKAQAQVMVAKVYSKTKAVAQAKAKSETDKSILDSANP